VIRNPYSRAISAVEYRHVGCYTTSNLHNTIHRTISTAIKNSILGRCVDGQYDCHFVPQWMYVEPHATSRWMSEVWENLMDNPTVSCGEIVSKMEKTLPSRGHSCNFLLKYENLTEELGRFVKRCGAFSMTKRPLPRTHESCKHKVPLPRGVKSLLQKLYSNDFVLFNYTF
jgi:hypothetical protein